MGNFLTLFSVIFILLSCNNSKKEKEFEGKIEFEIKVKCKDEAIKSGLEKTFGSKQVYTYKNGNYKREYFSPENKLIMTEIYLENENVNYVESLFNEDTLIKTEVGTKDCNISILKQEKSKMKILNYSCNYLEVSISNDTIPWMNYISKYWYPDDLFIRKNRFSQYKSGCLDYIYKILECQPLKYSKEMATKFDISVEVIFEATNVSIEEIDMEEFEINDSIPIKTW